MKIKEEFVEQILKEEFPQDYQTIYDNSPLLQYLDKKMKAIHGNSKSRQSLANIYAIYSILHFYQEDFYNQPDEYRKFRGYRYSDLKDYCCKQYGGRKLQNHAFNNRINGEFRNRFPDTTNNLFISTNGKYLLHIDYLYVAQTDISIVCCHIVEKYIELVKAKDRALFQTLQEMQSSTDYFEKKEKIKNLLSKDAEARIFEIISYAILKNHYKSQKIYWGTSPDAIHAEALQLYKTGRTNANDGGIDFVMRPIGRFFQVTEVRKYKKYLLDIDKVMHFPITFVVKTNISKSKVHEELNDYIRKRSGGMLVIEERYHNAIEEIITINELQQWIDALNNSDIDNIVQDIDTYYRLELNIDDLDTETF